MKVSEVFKSIQGEGDYAGLPVLFIRLGDCTRECDFCDTQYHKKYDIYDVYDIVKIIRDSELEIVVWTGGEPLLQLDEIKDVISLTSIKLHHIETNGDLIKSEKEAEQLSHKFDYMCVSPKDLKTTKRISKYFKSYLIGEYDIKIVTDLKLNKNLIKYATMLMPLTTISHSINKKFEQDVWNYCVKKNIKFCLRQHIHVWGNKKGI